MRVNYRRNERPYSPVRGIRKIEDPRIKPTEVPECHPTPKKDEDESYREFKKEVELAVKCLRLQWGNAVHSTRPSLHVDQCRTPLGI